MAYLLPTRRSRGGGRLSALLGVLPVPTPATMPRRLIATTAATFRPLTGYGLTLGILPSVNVRYARAVVPALAIARGRMAAAQTRSDRRRRRTGSLSGLGADGNCVYYAADGTTVESTDASSSASECSQNGGSWFPSGQPAGLPSPPQASQPILQAYKNVLTQATSSSNPLDYVSPQAAIAAGLDPAVVNAAWAKGLARFPTQQAAVDAGINPGVVNSLWQASRTSVFTGTGSGLVSWLAQNWTIPVAVVAGFSLLRGLRRR